MESIKRTIKSTNKDIEFISATKVGADNIGSIKIAGASTNYGIDDIAIYNTLLSLKILQIQNITIDFIFNVNNNLIYDVVVQ